MHSCLICPPSPIYYYCCICVKSVSEIFSVCENFVRKVNTIQGYAKGKNYVSEHLHDTALVLEHLHDPALVLEEYLVQEE
ncbi:hypothetical protein V6N12_065353 [Hibiscus sabdariffa]|uniref:Uncharacterized protein n=1 Tax=Hibiscus sabdariffa TaxID=183260 RepID=A0ABR2G8G9_9ROSI